MPRSFGSILLMLNIHDLTWTYIIHYIPQVADPDGADPVETFRELCGPIDPEIGRMLRPSTLRAQFGTSRVRNAIHCTDLPGDGPLEVSYFFDILQK